MLHYMSNNRLIVTQSPPFQFLCRVMHQKQAPSSVPYMKKLCRGQSPHHFRSVFGERDVNASAAARNRFTERRDEDVDYTHPNWSHTRQANVTHFDARHHTPKWVSGKDGEREREGGSVRGRGRKKIILAERVNSDHLKCFKHQYISHSSTVICNLQSYCLWH